VYDQFGWLWENVWYALTEQTTDKVHSIHALFWTKK
jgi:hypothetical protein